MGDTLNVGDELGLGQSLQGGAYTMTLQNDGNLVLSEPDGKVVWATKTHEQGVKRAVLQDDGNFVLYKDDGGVWSTKTAGKDAGRLVVQPDRNIVLYGKDGSPLWSSGTNTDNPIQASAAPASGGQSYTVAAGDTLWAIAERFYGDGNRYMEIATANNMDNPDMVSAGQTLTIP